MPAQTQSGIGAVVVARSTSIFSLRGWLVRWIDLGEGEMGVLLHRDTSLGTYQGPLHRPLLVWDDLLPGLTLDRRRLLRWQTYPFPLALRYSGVPTGNGGCLLCEAHLTVAVTDPARFTQAVSRLQGALETSDLARQVVAETRTPLHAQVANYDQDDLCHNQALVRKVAATLCPEWKSALASRGMSLEREEPSLSFLPQTPMQALQERIVGTLAERGLLERDDTQMLAILSQRDEALGEILSETLEEMLASEERPTQEAPPTKEPLALRLLLALSLLPTVAGIGTGGVLGSTVEHLKNLVGDAPQVGPILGGLSGMAIMGPFSLLAKWAIRRIWAKSEEAHRSRAIAQARAREAQAWAQVQLQRIHTAVQQAHARLTAFLAQPSIPTHLRPVVQQAHADISSTLTLLGSGFPYPGAVKGFAPREGLFTARLALYAYALPRLAESLVNADEEAWERVAHCAHQARTTLQEWQTYRLHLGRS